MDRENYRTDQGFAGGVDYRPEFDWSLDGQRVEFAVCYWTFGQLGIAGDNRCYYQIQVGTSWMRLRPSSMFGGPACRGDSNVDGAMDDFYPSNYRPTTSDETNINDLDGDGVFGENDAFPFDADKSRDLDGDGVGDNADPDRDGDGIDDEVDAYPDSDLGALILTVMESTMPLTISSRKWL